MNFTREPIVETVITPKEGFKLSIRNSRGSNLEEYSVDAVEVVSFGNSYFFRNREKPKAFILPLSEYEVLETRETRTILKTTQVEKSIKIGEQSKATTRTQEKKTSSKNISFYVSRTDFKGPFQGVFRACPSRVPPKGALESWQ